jgi:hypothetical protein
MRAVLLVIIIVIILLIVALATGLLNINQVRGGRVPAVSATGNGVSASGGQAPAFQVETGSIKVGSKPAQVKVPTVELTRAGNSAAADSNSTGH